MRPRWSPGRRLAKALELLRDPALEVLITGELAFADLPATLPRHLLEPGGALCTRIVYPKAG
jgi:hypothetical protein